MEETTTVVMDVTAWRLIGQKLDAKSLCKIGETCKHLKRVIDESDDVWLAAFERFFGALMENTKSDGEEGEKETGMAHTWMEECQSWKERVKRAYHEIPSLFASPPRPSLWTFGVWKVATIAATVPRPGGNPIQFDARSVFVGPGERILVEIPWGSTGWVYYREDNVNYTLWTSGGKVRCSFSPLDFLALTKRSRANKIARNTAKSA